MSTGTNAKAPSRRRLGGGKLAARQRLVAYGLMAPSGLLISGDAPTP